jgi:hypothetical protein
VSRARRKVIYFVLICSALGALLSAAVCVAGWWFPSTWQFGKPAASGPFTVVYFGYGNDTACIELCRELPDGAVPYTTDTLWVAAGVYLRIYNTPLTISKFSDPQRVFVPAYAYRLAYPTWAPCLVFGSLTLVTVVLLARETLRRRFRRRRGQCVRCGYDLRGSTTAQCAECGCTRDSPAPQTA